MTIVPETRASISPVDFLRAAKHTPAVEGNTQRLLLLDTARIVLLPRAYADVPFSPLDHPGTWPPFENTLFACLDCQSKRGTRAGLASLVSTIRKRHGYKGIQWKTIAIAGKSQVVKREGAPVNISEIMPLHECRGHFKEYSSSRPLFGKVSGKFFWHPHVRGRVTNGVVLHDKYEVKA